MKRHLRTFFLLAMSSMAFPGFAQTGKAKATGANPAIWTEPGTRLIWTKNDNGSDIAQQQAVAYCRNLSLEGFRDWRLPTIDELVRLFDPSGRPNFMKAGIALSLPSVWSSSPGKAQGQRSI
jgi:hypothetical protein